MRTIILSAFASPLFLLTSLSLAAASPSIYVGQISCQGGPFGLQLPSHLPDVMKLGHVEREQVDEVEQSDGYSATRKYVYFPGLTLGLVTFSNDPDRYLVSFAEVTGAQWAGVAPFRIGEPVSSVRAKLGSAAEPDTTLRASYDGDGAAIKLSHAAGHLKKITYDCYTG